MPRWTLTRRPAAPSSTSSDEPKPATLPDPPEPTPELDAALLRTLDLHILPLVMTLYLLSFLDRVNIGSARLYSLEADLSLTPTQFQTAVSILFVTYILFELPSNLVLKKFHPRRYIAAITVGWGLVATCTGLVNSYGALVACRLLLGALEAGLFPGLAVYLTLFYTKQELALRIGFLFVSAALAGACGGLLAYAIGFLDGVAGMHGWRWILILEGIPTVLAGVATLFLLADAPEDASYLSPTQKAYLAARMRRQQGITASAQQFHWADVRAAFRDWRVHAFALAQFGVDVLLYGYSTFLPTIMRAILPTKTTSTPVVQALTVPCYVLGAGVYLAVARLSDRRQRRALPTVAAAGVSMLGYIILLGAHGAPPGVRYMACFLIAAGLYVCVGLPLSWLPANSPRYGKRAAASAWQLTGGNCAGVVVPFIYPTGDAPRYTMGHAITLACIALGAATYTVLGVSYARQNARRARGEEDERVRGWTEEQVRELGDESPRFVYSI